MWRARCMVLALALLSSACALPLAAWAVQPDEVLSDPALEVRARALVGFDVERQAVFSFEPEAKAARIGLFDWLFAANRNFVLQRAMALTAAVAIAVSGFMMGGGIGTTVADERYEMNWPQTTDTNELTEFLASDGI